MDSQEERVVEYKAARTAMLAAVAFVWLASCGSGSSSSSSTPVTTPPPPTSPSPALAFALMDAGDGASTFNTFLAMSAVDGIAVRTNWQSLAPAKGWYDWSTIDAAVAAAASHRKRVSLHVLASVFGSPPSWIYSQGAQSYSYTSPTGATRTDPVPWDGVFLSEWSTFVSALASHLNTTGGLAQIQYVSIAVPVPEMSLVACSNGALSGGVAYSRATYLNAWKTSIQAMRSAFPGVTKLLPVPVGVICWPDNDGPTFYHDALDYSLGLGASGFSIYATDLNALGSARMNGVAADASRAPVALQFIWSATSDPTNRMQGSLKDAICSGLKTYKAGYFEVYKVDLQSADAGIQGAIRAIHSPSLCN